MKFAMNFPQVKFNFVWLICVVGIRAGPIPDTPVLSYAPTDAPTVYVPPPENTEAPVIYVPPTEVIETPVIYVPPSENADVPVVYVPPQETEVPVIYVPPPEVIETPVIYVPPPENADVPVVYVPPPENADVPVVYVPPPENADVPVVYVPPPETTQPYVAPAPVQDDASGRAQAIYVPPSEVIETPAIYVPPPETADAPVIYVPPPEITETPVVYVPPPEITETPVVYVPPPEITETPLVYVPPPENADALVIYVPPPETTQSYIAPAPVQDDASGRAQAIYVPPPEITETPLVYVPPPENADVPVIYVPPSEITETPVIYVPPPEITETPVVYVPPPEFTETPVIYVPPTENADVPVIYVPPTENADVPVIYVPPSETTQSYIAPVPVPDDASGRAQAIHQAGIEDHHKSSMHPLHPENRIVLEELQNQSPQKPYNFPIEFEVLPKVSQRSQTESGYNDHPKISSLYPLDPSTYFKKLETEQEEEELILEDEDTIPYEETLEYPPENELLEEDIEIEIPEEYAGNSDPSGADVTEVEGDSEYYGQSIKNYPGINDDYGYAPAPAKYPAVPSDVEVTGEYGNKPGHIATGGEYGVQDGTSEGIYGEQNGPVDIVGEFTNVGISEEYSSQSGAGIHSGYPEEEIESEEITGDDPYVVNVAPPHPQVPEATLDDLTVHADKSFSYVKAFNEILLAIDRVKKSLIDPMLFQIKVERGDLGETGHRMLVLCRLGRIRVSIQRATEAFFDTFDHWAKLGTSVEGVHCREEVVEAMRQLAVEVASVSQDLDKVGSEFAGHEPFDSIGALGRVMALTAYNLQEEELRIAQSTTGSTSHDETYHQQHAQPEKYVV